MRLCAALALVLVALVVVTVKAWPRRHARIAEVGKESILRYRLKRFLRLERYKDFAGALPVDTHGALRGIGS